MSQSVKDYVVLIRPTHWVKNFLVVTPPFFAGIIFQNLENFLTALFAFLSFSFASSAIYIFNDLVDIEFDRNHPTKKNRPIPSGSVSVGSARVLAAILLLLGLFIAVNINLWFTVTVVCYLVLIVAYTLGLKNIVIIESFCIAGGFLLRILAGGAASDVRISGWLILTTLFLSLLLAFGKRRAEINLSEDSTNFRKVLKDYDAGFLDSSLIVFSAASIITYSIYLIDTGQEILLLTVPFICFGILRYIYLVQIRSQGDPTDALMRDWWLLVCVFTWIVVTGIFIHFFNGVSFF